MVHLPNAWHAPSCTHQMCWNPAPPLADRKSPWCQPGVCYRPARFKLAIQDGIHDKCLVTGARLLDKLLRGFSTTGTRGERWEHQACPAAFWHLKGTWKSVKISRARQPTSSFQLRNGFISGKTERSKMWPRNCCQWLAACSPCLRSAPRSCHCTAPTLAMPCRAISLYIRRCP